MTGPHPKGRNAVEEALRLAGQATRRYARCVSRAGPMQMGSIIAHRQIAAAASNVSKVEAARNRPSSFITSMREGSKPDGRDAYRSFAGGSVHESPTDAAGGGRAQTLDANKWT